MAAYGPLEFYRNVQGANYPAVLYLLWPLAGIFHGDALRIAVKAISIPCDLALGVLLYAVVLGMASRARATLAAALYLLNPAAIIAGAYWGQLDSLGTLPFVGALVALGTRRFAAATALAVLAGLIKPQFGLVLLLVVAVLAIDAYRTRAWRPGARSLGAAALVIAALSIPLRLSVGDQIAIVRATADRFPYGSLYALNPWGVFTGFFQPDRYTTAGGALLVVGLALSALPLWRRRDLAAVLAAGAFVTFAFYFLPTRVHERYLFPAIAVLAIFAATRRRVLIPYLVLSACFTYGLILTLWSDSSSTFSVPQWVASTMLSRQGVVAVAIVLMGTAALIVWRLGQELLRSGRVTTPAAAYASGSRPAGKIRALTTLRFPAAAALLPWPRWSARRWLVTALVAAPMLFNAVALLPEVTREAPNINDDAMHFLYIQRADEALSRGENVLDFWMPEMELGFAPFVYYQHLPHLAVVALHRALLGTVSLLAAFDLVRYLLLVGLPLTVYWSMRRLGFPVAAAGASAAVSTLLSSNGRFDFEYGSFVFRGWGMFTQLWAVHLTFMTLATLKRLVDKGTGLAWAVAALSALALSHLIYAYMMAFTAALLFAIGISRTNWRPRASRLAVLGGATALITSYMWLPFLQLKPYFNVSQPYLPSWRFDSFGAPTILGWLTSGDLLDHGRLPVITALVAIGIGAALVRRTRIRLFALGVFVMWLVLYFGRATLGRLADLLPLNAGLHVHRFIGGVDLGVIMLVGLAGAAIWQLSARLPRARVAVLAVLAVLMFAPVAQERWAFYADNSRWLDQTATAVDRDTDAKTILDTLGSLPQGRTYAGLHNEWGDRMNFGLRFNSAHFSELLLLHRVPLLVNPKISLSINADVQWDFNDREAASYELYDVRYAVAATGYAVPAFLRPLRVTPRYTLYEAPTHGFAVYAATTTRESASTDAKLFGRIRAWALGADSAARNYIRFDYPSDRDGPSDATTQGCADAGTLSYERLERDRLEVNVSCSTNADLVLKMTYHPNWHVTVDGVGQPAFMVSPSFIGVTLPAGRHVVVARYESTPLKTPLAILGLLTFVAVALAGRSWRRWLVLPRSAWQRIRVPVGAAPTVGGTVSSRRLRRRRRGPSSDAGLQR